MAEKLVNEEGLKEYTKKIKEDVPLIGTTSTGNLPNFGSYSLEETETPYTWIDGKTIYKKTIFGSYTNDGSTIKTLSTGLSIANAFLVKEEGVAYTRTEKHRFSLPIVGGTENFTLGVRYITSDLSEIQLRSSTAASWANLDVYITLYYTKS